MTTPPPSRDATEAIRRFLDFYAVLVETKRLASSLMAVEPAPAEEELADGQVARRPVAPSAVRLEDLHLRLRDAILAEGGIERTGGIPDAGYAMAALADEAMLHMVDWPGRRQWMGMLIEERLYGSRVSGERMFRLAEDLAAGRIPNRADLAAAILLALALGFRGRWRRLDDHGAIDDHGKIGDLKRRLYEVVFHRPPPAEVDWSSLASAPPPPPDRDWRPPRLPLVAPWLAGIAASILISVALAHSLWLADVKDMLSTADAVSRHHFDLHGEGR